MPSIEELKARLAGLNRSGGKGKDIWKPSDKHDIRLVPYPHGRDPFIEMYFHYDVGDAPVLCPKQNQGEDCAICEFADKLKSWNSPNGEKKSEVDKKGDWELFRKIQAKASVFVPMVERGKESEGAKFWRISGPASTEILQEAMNSDRMEACGISKDEQDAEKLLQVLIGTEKAYDLDVDYKKKGEKGNNTTYAQTVIRAKIKTSSLGKNAEETKAIVGSVKKIDDVYPPQSSADVAKIFAKWTGGGQSEAKADGGSEKYAGKSEKTSDKKTNSSEKAKTSGRTIEDAFADMSDDKAA